jgi:Tfp pilus assembly protein PilV
MIRYKKRHAILLEVMIAFALIALCALPLLYSHAYILKEQQEFLHKVKLDHVVSLLYAQFHEKLHNNEFSWDSLNDKIDHPIDPSLLTLLNDNNPLPYNGTFRFEINRWKGSNKPFTLNLLNLTFTFTPFRSTKTFAYEYQIMAAHRKES